MSKTPVDSKTKRTSVATIQVACGAALIGFSPVFAKIAEVGPATTAFYRLAIGGLILVAVLSMRSKKTPTVWNWRTLILPSVCGIIVAIDLSAWHHSIDLIGPGLATILGNHQVFVLAGFGILFLGERLTGRLAAAIGCAMVGLFLIFGLEWDQFDSNTREGVAFGALTALMYGSYLIVLRSAQARQNALSPMGTVATLSIVAAMFLGFYVWLGGESFHVPDTTTWGVLVAYAVVAHILGWVLISTGISKIPASRAGLLLLLQPALAFVWDVVLFSRPTKGVEILGAVIALGAIYLGAQNAEGRGQSKDKA